MERGVIMEKLPMYVLPKLAFGYKDLEPYISEQQLTIHHTKHHQAYVTGANGIIDKMYDARTNNTDLDLKSTLKSLSFNVGGNVLHEYYWMSLTPASKSGKPTGAFAAAIDQEFGSFERFKKEFTQTATSVEGSGWAMLALCDTTMRPTLMQVEKHNTNVYPAFPVIMAVDVWEHAYYLDYKNDRAKYIDSIWNIINWPGISKRWDSYMKWLPKWE
jgi:superoxide dismutase, Fe-Mn family